MKTMAIILIALLLWMAGINGNLGSLLAAVINPGAMQEQTGFAGNPNVNGSSGDF